MNNKNSNNNFKERLKLISFYKSLPIQTIIKKMGNLLSCNDREEEE
jgi:hypothetical protein